MSLEKLSHKYIISTEKVLREMKITKDILTVQIADVERIVNQAKDYLEDAKYYKEKKRFATSLSSIAYSEGLLDALKLLGAAKFEWSIIKKTKNEK